jgi:tRNA nucleotidyltransferase (CCA-adding enzyme)
VRDLIEIEIDARNGENFCDETMELITLVTKLKEELAASQQLNIREAALILTQFKEDTETTDFLYPQMKRTMIAGIQACLIKLANEASKR